MTDGPAWRACVLLRAARAATLATHAAGQPYAALVTPAIAPDGAALVLLSGLSEHTRHLRDDGRCALLVAGDATGPNPQTAPRLAVMAQATPALDPALRARWLAIHPYAAFYADLPDFTLWRLAPTRAHFVAGFGAAYALGRDDLAPDPAAVAALLAAEPDILAHCNDHHGGALDAIACAHAPTADAGWRLVAVDVAGCHLARGDHVVRVAWPAPVDAPSDVRKNLARLATTARSPPRLDPAASLP